MKKAITLSLLWLASQLAWAADAPAPDVSTLTGTVLEVKDVESYSYLRLKTKDGETWAAVERAALKPGAKVTIENATMMTNFESKSLKRSFPSIWFGNLAGAGGAASADAMAKAHGGMMSKPAAAVADVNVAKATGPDARTVAEIVSKRAELKDKAVTIRGKVVKYNAGIMGKNWVHLRDGSGKEADGSNDLLVTTADATQVGAVVVARGTVRTDKDFGAGYAYKVLVEDASLKP
ncbi:MAG TPA: hypothetical protein VF816_11100 [Rhodocyclaceae bacterium]